MKKVLFSLVLIVTSVTTAFSADWSFNSMFTDMKDTATGMSKDARDSVKTMSNDSVNHSGSLERTTTNISKDATTSITQLSKDARSALEKTVKDALEASKDATGNTKDVLIKIAEEAQSAIDDIDKKVVK